MAENIENNSGFGLPEVTMKPLTEATAPKPPVQRTPRRPEKKSNAPLFIGLFLGALAIAAGIWWFTKKDGTVDQVADVDPIEDVIDDTADDMIDDIVDEENIVTDDVSDDISTANESTATANSSTASHRNRGHISNVTSRTGRAYVIAGSFIDVDLANDYGKKLARRGVNTKIISPEGDNKFFRLSVADYGSISAAARNLDRLKATYGDNLWVIKH